ncbi:conserved Plasmodium protein, unknown function [Plasmodium gallinaceum]|uniref:Uncharacterized protein n=1 Tax=Plasmodium gallinaceum TaxID=5849 RepID=A0A1J1GWS3_PLAGA|nr:conserved Plasmodium protein, unknown function [Plasmodium gallinaceum]CRG96711.1 conserved Plasmodium protein, unknown function [Plasmodium gallinaceum]
MDNKMLMNQKENDLKKKFILEILLLILLYSQYSFQFIYSFSIKKKPFVLNAIAENDGIKKSKLRENKKILLEIGNSLKEQNVKKSLANLDDLLNCSKDKKLSKKMSTICGNVLNLCSKFNDISNMIKIIEKMKIHNVEMQENSYLAICNYYISNNYIYEYLLTINKMIEKKITIRERFYKYILTNILDLSFDQSYYKNIINNETNQKKESLVNLKNCAVGTYKIEKKDNNNDYLNVNNKRDILIKNIDYTHFEDYKKKLNKYDIVLEEADKLYVLNNYLLIDIFKHMNDNKIKIKLIYILKLINYVYENILYIMNKKSNDDVLKDTLIINNENREIKKKKNNNKEEYEKRKNFFKDILIEQLRYILELYKSNYESMNINIKKYEENVDEEERRSIYYYVNKITKKLPFIKLTENIKNSYNCKNCEENINTYFLSLKHIIIVIVNIILITHLFNNKEIFKIKHFFSILNGFNNINEEKEEKNELEKYEAKKDELSEALNEKKINRKNEEEENKCENKEKKKNHENIESDENNYNDMKKVYELYENKNNFLNNNEMNNLFEKGSYTCILDGANIGYNKQNVENGCFSFLQIEIIKEILKKKKNENPLIILPKIYHYKNSLKYIEGNEKKNEKNSNIFIPNKTVKIKKTNLYLSENNHNNIKMPEKNSDSSGNNYDNKYNSEFTEKNDQSSKALSYIKRIFNKLNDTDIEIIKKWEKEKCLYICNYNMYDDYYYILGSLAKSNKLFNIYYYIDKLSNHFYKYENLNHNIIIDNYNIIDDNIVYVNREILYVYNNIIFDKNSDIIVLVSSESVNKENKYISMNEQYYNDKIKKKNINLNLFEDYKRNLKLKDKDNVPYEKNIYMDTYIYDLKKSEHILVTTTDENEEKRKEGKLNESKIIKKNDIKDSPKNRKLKKNLNEKEAKYNEENFYYSNIYVKCVTDLESSQKPIYIYTNDKMKNHYFNEYTNFILKKWKKKSFISFYFKKPIFLSELQKQKRTDNIDLTNLIDNYKLPYVNLENFKLYIDDIVSYKNKNVYHIKLNSPNKTFFSYHNQNDSLPFIQYNNIVKYLCIDFSKI